MSPRDDIGFVDLHAHLIPGVDDGCADIAESVACARQLVDAGFSHCFCTPHIWPHLINNTVDHIREWTAGLQKRLDAARVPLRLFPGGEMSLQAKLSTTTPADQLVTFALARRHVLVDIWADVLPPHFEPTVRWMQSLGLTVVLAHPERMRAVQMEPALVEEFNRLGLLLQGNLQCFADPPGAPTRQTAERLLRERRYFALATDTHGADSLPIRLEGLRRVTSVLHENELQTLLRENPATLLP